MIPPPNRLLSLDAMRGFTVAVMIVANFPGSEEFVYFPLRHSPWNGLSVTDLIAPTFLFIVGVSIALAYAGKRTDGGPTAESYRKIGMRSLNLFAVGMFLNLLPDFDFPNARWTGTLHRIAVVFGVRAVLFLNTTWRQQVWIGIITLVAYWLAMTQIPTPDVGRVSLEPGRNLAAWLDRQYLPGRMWQGTWDPEGILNPQYVSVRRDGDRGYAGRALGAQPRQPHRKSVVSDDHRPVHGGCRVRLGTRVSR